MKNLFNISGKTALVTGCTSGIGSAISEGLSQYGVNIVGTYCNGDPNFVRDSVLKNEVNFFAVQSDFLDEKELNKIVFKIFSDYPDISIIVNNAAVNLRDEFLHYSEQDWHDSLLLNVSAPLKLCQKFSAHIIKKEQPGKIINILSLCAQRGGYFNTGYTASKHALLGLTKSMANELGKHDICINALIPGFIETKMTRDFLSDDSKAESFKKRISLGRWGKPEDLVGACVFLASDASNYITGETIAIDGGYQNF